ncbi:molybdate ABC transporter substrate-binding protein [Halobacillus andaensis]|uniref:molybdate ABC transporter substrate-binding protein n=1 Tax=Halobacillus andaensis TaxID=1176239 RepID=UPI003D71D7E3
MYTNIKAFCFIVLLVLTGCQQSTEQEVELTISAASSTIDVMEEIIEKYESDHNVTITLNSGSSGKLAQQIQHGAPVDLFISANEQWSNRLAAGENIRPDTQTSIVKNTLILIAPTEKQTSIDNLNQLTTKEDQTIALGEPDSAPAGKYAKQALMNAGIWGEVLDQLVYGNDVRQVLAYVESGNADYGLVYASDAQITDKVKIIAEIDTNTHDPIIYPAAVTSQSNNTEAAEDFLRYLKTDIPQEIFKSYGFKLEQE